MYHKSSDLDLKNKISNANDYHLVANNASRTEALILSAMVRLRSTRRDQAEDHFSSTMHLRS